LFLFVKIIFVMGVFLFFCGGVLGGGRVGEGGGFGGGGNGGKLAGEYYFCPVSFDL